MELIPCFHSPRRTIRATAILMAEYRVALTISKEPRISSRMGQRDFCLKMSSLQPDQPDPKKYHPDDEIVLHLLANASVHK